MKRRDSNCWLTHRETKISFGPEGPEGPEGPVESSFRLNDHFSSDYQRVCVCVCM